METDVSKESSEKISLYLNFHSSDLTSSSSSLGYDSASEGSLSSGLSRIHNFMSGQSHDYFATEVANRLLSTCRDILIDVLFSEPNAIETVSMFLEVF